ncbi:hypothetical protein LWH94_16145 [Marinobacter sp. G11]|uniref:hypothetical protein n=1 Tax=Marinobacter sp. G11 TaxID=2903522 RepID=UPI001E30DE57|nr:hypothetical protein [Marinobacter sp. G11]MCE0760723.1 hypothetical protein [Marinobacter sp. G11]
MIRMLLLLLIVADASCASGDVKSGQEQQTLNIAVIEDVPSVALGIRLLRAAYKELNIELVIHSFPSRRALLMAEQGVMDGDLFRVEAVGNDSESLVKVPYPLLEGQLFAVTREPVADWKASAQESPQLVAIRRGVIVEEMTAASSGLEPVPTASYAQVNELLERGRVSVALVSEIEGFSPMQHASWSKFHQHAEPVTTFTLYHYLHERHKDLIQPLARILRRLDQSGVKRKILEQTHSESTADTW